MRVSCDRHAIYTGEGPPVSQVALSYGVARSWVYALVARYHAEGEAAFEETRGDGILMHVAGGHGFQYASEDRADLASLPARSDRG